jgi:hypothetical protein
VSDRRDIDRSFEEALDALLRQSLEPGGVGCPSPDLLGAYLGGHVSAAETEAIDHHVASCDLCQQHMAALAEMEPAAGRATGEPLLLTVEAEEAPSPPDATVPEPPGETGVEPPLEAEAETQPFALAPPRRKARKTMRWVAAPLALAATAVLGVLLTRRLEPQLKEVSLRSSGVVAKTAPELSAPAPQAPEIADQFEKKTEPEKPQALATAPSAFSDAAPPPVAAPTAAAAAPAVEPEAKGGAASFGVAAKPQSRPAPPAETAKRDVESDKDERERGANLASPVEPFQASKERAEEPPTTRPNSQDSVASSDAGSPHAKSAELGALARQAPAAPVGAAAASPPVESRTEGEIRISVPSNAKVLWRLLGATIERSDDAGATWQTQLVGTKRLSAGDAISPKVCWVVGVEGSVLRTIDGKRWTRLEPPAADDVVRVSASNASSATVRLADGRRFATTDGGRTWSKR